MVQARIINETTPVEVTSENQETTVDVTSQSELRQVNVGGLSHKHLSGRDLPDQHPISAITGLQEALTATAQEIGAIGQTIGSYGDIVTHNVIEFATAAQGTLADTAVQPSALIGYATQSWVTNQGYLTEIPAEYVTDSELTAKGYQTEEQVELAITSKGYITGITSSDVTTALGYIPYSSSNPSGYITSAALEPYVLSADLSAVATSGAYSDLSGQPTIPTDTGDLTNGAGFITSSALSGYATESWVGQQGYLTSITSANVIAALGYTPYNSSNPSGYITSAALTGYATESYVTTATANMQTTGNLVTSISSTSTDSQYPSAKCVYDIVGDIESAINTIRGV